MVATRVVLWTVVAAAAAVGLAAGSRAADHGDAPDVRNDTRIDINDVYLFASPETPANTVIAMTVCPLAGATGPRQFTPKIRYQINVDTNGDAMADQVYWLLFAKPDATGAQKFKLQGPNRLKVDSTTQFSAGATGTAIPSGGRVFAGLRDDPFFFDLIGFKRGLAFSAQTSRNFFDGLNTMAIVLEVPTASFGTLTNSTMGVWASTTKGKKQLDRMGRPAINTVLVGGANKDAFNQTAPKDDQTRWRTEVVNSLKAAPLLRTDMDANALADVLLPDVLTYDPTNANGFLNGRKLDDDVIDAELALLSNGAVTTDFVANDSTFLATFPYLGNPNP